jgi:predicted PurR-regulated permease PerM
MPPSIDSNPPRPERQFSSGDIVRAALVVLGLIVVLQFLWSARLLVLTTFLGILLGLSAARATDWVVARTRVKRTIAAVGVVFGTLGLLAGLFAWAGPTLFEQTQQLRQTIPESIEKLEVWIGKRQPGLLNAIAPLDTAKNADSIDAGSSRLMSAVERHAPTLTDFAFGILQSTFVVIAGIVLVIFLVVFIAVDPDVYRRGMLLLLPVERRDRFGEFLTELSTTLRTWLFTQFISMVVVGVVTGVVLAMLGVRSAIPLGVIAGIFEFIPNIGPILAAVPAVLMGFVESPQQALIIAGVYAGIQFLESNLLIPWLMNEQLDLPPALTLVAQVAIAYVFGFLGLFVAIPLLATAMVAVKTFWVEDETPTLLMIDEATTDQEEP